ncbi:MAG: rhomboid family intramembrane serine protease [Nitrospira sp.]|nr:rhomboid family intramembrane serine protease [Nitrospira sp.]
MLPLRDDNPTERPPIVTIAIIAACVLVFAYQFTLPDKPGQAFAFQYGAIPAAIFGHATLPTDIAATPAALTLLTSMFLHGGWMHLLGNMLYLWIFGNNIEDAMGHFKFAVFYTLCGILAALSHALTDPSSQIPMVGASGAISAILGAYLLLYPRARVLVLIPPPFFGTVSVPAIMVLGFWFLGQLYSGGLSLGSHGGGIAFFAHIGGFIAGMALVGIFKQREVPFFAPAHSGRY